MKHLIIASALMLALNAGAAGVQPRHRHHPQTEQVDTTAYDELEAFSDTTASDLAGEEDTVCSSGTMAVDDDYDDAMDGWVGRMLAKVIGGTVGIGGVLIAIVIILALLLCALAPFIVVILFIRYLINNNNRRASLAEKAMETGRPIPEEVRSQDRESPEYYKKRGIMKIAIGIGLTIMFAMWDAEVLSGVGLLIACWGVGQLVISKISK